MELRIVRFQFLHCPSCQKRPAFLHKHLQWPRSFGNAVSCPIERLHALKAVPDRSVQESKTFCCRFRKEVQCAFPQLLMSAFSCCLRWPFLPKLSSTSCMEDEDNCDAGSCTIPSKNNSFVVLHHRNMLWLRGIGFYFSGCLHAAILSRSPYCNVLALTVISFASFLMLISSCSPTRYNFTSAFWVGHPLVTLLMSDPHILKHHHLNLLIGMNTSSMEDSLQPNQTLNFSDNLPQVTTPESLPHL